MCVSPNSVMAKETGFGAQTKISALSDSNIFRTRNEYSEQLLAVEPWVSFKEEYGKHDFDISYRGKYVNYKNNSALNYGDHKVSGSAIFDHSSKFMSHFKVSLEDKIETPGINNSITQIIDEFNQRHIVDFSAIGEYGRDNSIGQFILEYKKSSNTYKNNQQDFRDYDSDRITASFFYRLAPKTRLLIEASSSDVKYNKNTNFNYSSRYNNYLIGAEWQATAKTKSVFKIGLQEQDFENNALNDISGLSYYADIYWRANTYSLLQLGASRTTSESSEIGIGSFIRNSYTARLTHSLSNTFSVNTAFKFNKDDVVFSDNRTDKYRNLSFNLTHKTHKDFNLFIGTEFSQRDSIDTRYEYDVRTISIGIIGHFGRKLK